MQVGDVHAGRDVGIVGQGELRMGSQRVTLTRDDCVAIENAIRRASKRLSTLHLETEDKDAVVQAMQGIQSQVRTMEMRPEDTKEVLRVDTERWLKTIETLAPSVAMILMEVLPIVLAR